MGLLDGVEKFLEETLFKQMQIQFDELVKIMREIRDNLNMLVKLQIERNELLRKSRKV